MESVNIVSDGSMNDDDGVEICMEDVAAQLSLSLHSHNHNNNNNHINNVILQGEMDAIRAHLNALDDDYMDHDELLELLGRSCSPRITPKHQQQQRQQQQRQRRQQEGDTSYESVRSAAPSQSSKNGGCHVNEPSSARGVGLTENALTTNDNDNHNHSNNTSLNDTVDNEDDDEDEVFELEVLYNEGATPLFVAIEESHWHKAVKIATEHPEQAKTWVVSTGTVATTFSWSLWRRLPLHEACRRQAPAWLISRLLSLYPSSAALATQFGELPLHLSVECGAAPEVVNLLVLAHWRGIVTSDKSGRTPLQVFHETDELLAVEDHKVVYESLLRAKQTYEMLMKEKAHALKRLKLQHSAGLVAVRQQHDDDLQAEQKQNEKLLVQVQALKFVLMERKKVEQDQAAALAVLHSDREQMQTEMAALQHELQTARMDLANTRKHVASLQGVVREQALSNQGLRLDVSQLQRDLSLTVLQRHQANLQQMQATQEQLYNFCKSFSQLQDELHTHGDALSQLVEQRGCNTIVNEEEEEDEDEEEDQEEANNEIKGQDENGKVAGTNVRKNNIANVEVVWNGSSCGSGGNNNNGSVHLTPFSMRNKRSNPISNGYNNNNGKVRDEKKEEISSFDDNDDNHDDDEDDNEDDTDDNILQGKDTSKDEQEEHYDDEEAMTNAFSAASFALR